MSWKSTLWVSVNLTEWLIHTIIKLLVEKKVYLMAHIL